MPWPIIAGAAISGLSGLLGGREQAQAAEQAGVTARRQYGQARQDFAPYTSLGAGAAGILGQLQGTYASGQPAGVGGSGLSAQGWGAIAPLWSQIRPAARFEDINWGAIGQPGGAPVSEADKQFLSANWGNIRPAGNLGDVDWNAFTQAPSTAQAPGASPGMPAPDGGAGQPGAPDWSAFFQSPEYGFNLSEGQKAIERMGGSGAGGLSGRGTKEALRFSQGLASNQAGSFVDRLLASAGLGAGAAGNVASLGANAAGQQMAAQEAGGNARASQYGAIGNAALGGVSDFLLNKYLGGGGTQRQANSASSYPTASTAGANPGVGAQFGANNNLLGLGGGNGFRIPPGVQLAPGLSLPPWQAPAPSYQLLGKR